MDIMQIEVARLNIAWYIMDIHIYNILDIITIYLVWYYAMDIHNINKINIWYLVLS